MMRQQSGMCFKGRGRRVIREMFFPDKTDTAAAAIDTKQDYSGLSFLYGHCQTEPLLLCSLYLF